MIRDWIVVGLQDKRLSEQLQLDPDITQENVVAQVRQSEAVKKQQPLIRGEIVILRWEQYTRGSATRKNNLPRLATQCEKHFSTISKDQHDVWQYLLMV